MVAAEMYPVKILDILFPPIHFFRSVGGHRYQAVEIRLQEDNELGKMFPVCGLTSAKMHIENSLVGIFDIIVDQMRDILF